MGPDEQTKSKEKGGSFSMSICRNLNPYASSGGHCSTPSGICLHTPDGRHVVSTCIELYKFENKSDKSFLMTFYRILAACIPR